MPTILGLIVSDIEKAYVEAKAQGMLEADILQISAAAAQKIHALDCLSDSEKKAFVVFALKKGGVAASGKSDPDAKVVRYLDAIQPRLSCVKQFLLKYLPCCSQVVAALDPKDVQLVAEAMAFVESSPDVLSEKTVASSQESGGAAPPAQEEGNLVLNTPEMEPSQEASVQVVPALTLRVD